MAITPDPPTPEPPEGGWSLRAGDLLGSYAIVAPIAAGGMGEVYRARHTFLSRDAAIKVLQVARETTKDYKQRFMEEMSLQCKLTHPNLVRLLDANLTSEGRPWMAMELLEGSTLAELLGAEQFTLREALRILIEIADGVGSAHILKVVHRDLKPSNVFVTTSGGVKVLDWGTAKLLDRTLVPTNRKTTDRMRVLGTRPYMSPEQVAGQNMTARSDIFSFGLLAYHMIVGVHPFAEGDGDAIELRIATLPHEPLRRSVSVSRALSDVIDRCLEKRPEARFPSMDQVSAALTEALRALGPARQPYAAAAWAPGTPSTSSPSAALATHGRFGTEIVPKLNRGKFGTELLPKLSGASFRATSSPAIVATPAPLVVAGSAGAESGLGQPARSLAGVTPEPVAVSAPSTGPAAGARHPARLRGPVTVIAAAALAVIVATPVLRALAPRRSAAPAPMTVAAPQTMAPAPSGVGDAPTAQPPSPFASTAIADDATASAAMAPPPTPPPRTSASTPRAVATPRKVAPARPPPSRDIGAPTSAPMPAPPPSLEHPIFD